MNKIEIIRKIKKFLDGHSDLKYVVNVEAYKHTNFATCFIHEPRGNGFIKKRSDYYYKPFIYVKDLEKHGHKLYEGHIEKLIEEKKTQHGIIIEKMRTDKQKRLEDGYLYKVMSTKSLNNILEYFKEGGVDPYETERDENGKEITVNNKTVKPNLHLFYILKPVEQFLISSGIRLYKGFDSYDDIHRVIFDIETTGLRHQSSNLFSIGIRDNRGYEKILEANDFEDGSETETIKNFFKEIIALEPAVIAGFNSENFDFPYMLGRLEELNQEIGDMETTISPGKKIFRGFGTLKVGNTTEKYTATKMYGMSVIDIHHAVKRKAVVDSDMKLTNLKYVCNYEEISKPNRVYVDGDDNNIYEIYKNNKIFITDKNFNYEQIPEKFQEEGKMFFKIQMNQKKRKITSDQAKKLKIEVLKKSSKDFIGWFKEMKSQGKQYFITGKGLIRRYLKDDLWETQQIDDLYNQSSFMMAKIVPTTYERVCTMGTATIWELLLTTWSFENNLAIPINDEKSDFSGGLARCFKRGFTENIIKIDYSSLYPFIQLTHDTFPSFDIDGVMKMMLTYLTTTRNIYKKISSGVELDESEVELLKNIDEYLSEKYANRSIDKKDKKRSNVKQAPIKIINNSLYGALGSDMSFKWSDTKCAARITCVGRIELRHVIKWFDDYGCTPLLAVTDGVSFQIPLKTNIKIDDDKVEIVDFHDSPKKMWLYGGHTGIHALIQKFNIEEMPPPYMSVDDDGSAFSSLNLSRINYATLFKERDENTGEIKDRIKLTGNTIKSKIMSEYIEDFLDKGLKLILNGQGREFINYYYEYVEDIFYKRIPLKKIASKSKIKTNIKGYLNRGKDKNGRLKAVQAHMELVIQEREHQAKELFVKHANELIENKDEFKVDKFGFDDVMKFATNDENFVLELTEAKIKKLKNGLYGVIENYMPPELELDSTIYYVNTGYRKSHGDSSIIKDKETGKKRMASKLIDKTILLENPDMVGEYNIDKYLDAFNSRVEKFLIGFDEEVRKRIPAKIKREKKINKFGVKVEHEELIKNTFTEEETKLKNFDLDDLDESLYLEPKEITFWNKYGYNPYKIWDGIKVKPNELKYDQYLLVFEYVNRKIKEKTGKELKKIDDVLEENDLVLMKEDDQYHLGKYDGTVTKIIRYDIDIPVEIRGKNKTPKDEETDKKIEDLRPVQTEEDDKLNEYFVKFKERFNVEGQLDELKMNEFFGVIPEARGAFEKFINEEKNTELGFDDE